VFPGGARIRPRLCLSVAVACGDDRPLIADTAAASIELLQCASLGQDDLRCFDDGGMRRGKPAVHVAFGRPLAVLAGDALLVLAFESLGRAVADAPERLAPLHATVAGAVGAPRGIIAGQAWESEERIDLAAYQRAKTGALFACAAIAGAQAAGADPARWRAFGEILGEAYQVADDIRDIAARPCEVGKPVSRDALLGRPNAAAERGLDGAVEHLDELVAASLDAIPTCPGAASLRTLVEIQAQRFLPKSLVRRAA
jgi:geranylgeranyl diphosphate synthase type II